MIYYALVELGADRQHITFLICERTSELARSQVLKQIDKSHKINNITIEIYDKDIKMAMGEVRTIISSI